MILLDLRLKQQLVITSIIINDWNDGLFATDMNRTSKGTNDFNYLVQNGWSIEGAGLRFVGIARRNP